MSAPFETSNGQEVLSKEVTARSPIGIVVALVSISLTHGIDRVESAIKATYTNADASRIIGMMNFAFCNAKIESK
jgi:hypothetical protein